MLTDLKQKKQHLLFQLQELEGEIEMAARAEKVKLFPCTYCAQVLPHDQMYSHVVTAHREQA